MDYIDVFQYVAIKAASLHDRAEQFKALADPRRLQILELLRRTGCCSCIEVPRNRAGMCVCDLETALGELSQPTVSHHLEILRRAGLIETRKLGRWVYCRRNEEAIARLAQALGRTL